MLFANIKDAGIDFIDDILRKFPHGKQIRDEEFCDTIGFAFSCYFEDVLH